LTAALTGLRRGELLQLEWRDLHLDAEKPFVNVRASISKNHKQAMLPLHSDLVAALGRLQTDGASPTGFVFQGMIPRMRIVHKDLKAAGIPYVDAKGEYADFHSLRKTFGTMLTLAGVPQRVVMELMRHSDMRLTAKTYTDAGMLPTDSTVANLPSLNAAIPAPQIAPQKSVQALPMMSNGVRESELVKFAGTRSSKGFEGDLAVHVHPWPIPSIGVKKSGRQDSNLRPLGPKRKKGIFGTIWQDMAHLGTVWIPEPKPFMQKGLRAANVWHRPALGGTRFVHGGYHRGYHRPPLFSEEECVRCEDMVAVDRKEPNLTRVSV